MEKRNSKRRDFGGSEEKDWFDLHENIDPTKGLTKNQAETLAKFLRILGYAAKKDPLGGSGHLGVYYRKKKGSQKVKIGTITPDMLNEWFAAQTGVENSPVFESTVSNYLAQNPHLITGDQNKSVSVWREQELGDSQKGRRTRVDLILQSEDVVWIIEVKYTSTFRGALNPLGKAVKSVQEYCKEIQKLGWWGDKRLQLVVIWATFNKPPQYGRAFFEANKLPLKY